MEKLSIHLNTVVQLEKIIGGTAKVVITLFRYIIYVSLKISGWPMHVELQAPKKIYMIAIVKEIQQANNHARPW